MKLHNVPSTIYKLITQNVIKERSDEFSYIIKDAELDKTQENKTGNTDVVKYFDIEFVK